MNSVMVLHYDRFQFSKCSGYMSPEYAMEGVFSVKSDVFAFGVLMLEIITGKKNTGFYGSEYVSLLGYVSPSVNRQMNFVL